nr:hypothetical protein [Halolamina pelagica]
MGVVGEEPVERERVGVGDSSGELRRFVGRDAGPVEPHVDLQHRVERPVVALGGRRERVDRRHGVDRRRQSVHFPVEPAEPVEFRLADDLVGEVHVVDPVAGHRLHLPERLTADSGVAGEFDLTGRQCGVLVRLDV